jgi:hypothetical protein
MRNTVRFQSTIFNSTEPRPYFINPCCFGDDVGVWLKAKLAESGYDVDGPDQEDWGWYLVCRSSRGNYYLNIGHTGDEWQVIVERQRSFTEWLIRKSKDPAPELTSALHRILTVPADIQVTEWLNLDARGRESDIGQEP